LTCFHSTQNQFQAKVQHLPKHDDQSLHVSGSSRRPFSHYLDADTIPSTGGTGYIGGDAYYALHEAHPDWDYTLLVRNEDSAKKVLAKYPDAKFAYGDLDSSDVIEKAAAAADIVVRES
jgi:hypothetical protein